MTAEVRSAKPPGQPPGRPPILFIHGILHGAWCWADPWREFFNTRGFAAHWLSLSGHDGTPSGRQSLRWTSLADYAEDVVHAAAALDEAPILVGHSLGAMLIQMRLRQLNPPAVILLAPTHPAAFRRAAWRCFRRHPRLFLQIHRQGRLRLAVPTPEECREWLFSDSTPDEVVAWCFERLEEESYRVCLQLLLRPGIVRRVHCCTPVLVLGAGRDRSVPQDVTERVASLHGVRAEFFEGMGHDLMLEPGWERVAERIVFWLQELGLGASRRDPPLPHPVSRKEHPTVDVLIADNHPLVRKALRQAVEKRWADWCVREAGDGERILELCESSEPDVVILDLDLRKLDGLATLRLLRHQHRSVRVVLWTMHDDAELIREAMSLGAQGYVLKDDAIRDCLQALELALENKHYLSPALLDRFMRGEPIMHQPGADPNPTARAGPERPCKDSFRSWAERMGVRGTGGPEGSAR